MTDPSTPGPEPMSAAQRLRLKTLSEQAQVPFDDSLSASEAARRIDELVARTGASPADNALESLGRAVSDTVLGSQAAGGQETEPR